MDSDVQRRAGTRLRKRREDRGWAREELARRAGVSLSLLAQLERGEANPSLMTLDRLADAAGVTLAELVAAEASGSTLAHVEATTMWRGHGDSRSVLLAGASGGNDTELWRYDLAGGDAYEGSAHRPGSQVLVHVLDGKIELAAGEDTTEVAAGESARFRSDVAHRYANPTDRAATFVLVYTRAPGVHGA